MADDAVADAGPPSRQPRVQGCPFAPYEGQRASKLGRSQNEGIPELHTPNLKHRRPVDLNAEAATLTPSQSPKSVGFTDRHRGI